MKKWIVVNISILSVLITIVIGLFLIKKSSFDNNIQVIIPIIFGGLVSLISTFLANYFNYSLKKDEFENQEKSKESEKNFIIYERIFTERVRAYNELGDLSREMKLSMPPLFNHQNEFSFPVMFFSCESLLEWKSRVVGLLARNYGWYASKAANEIKCLSAYLEKLQEILHLHECSHHPQVIQHIGNILDEDIDVFAEKFLEICDLFFGEEIFYPNGQRIIKNLNLRQKGVARKLKNTTLFKKESEVREIAFPS